MILLFGKFYKKKQENFFRKFSFDLRISKVYSFFWFFILPDCLFDCNSTYSFCLLSDYRFGCLDNDKIIIIIISKLAKRNVRKLFVHSPCLDVFFLRFGNFYGNPYFSFRGKFLSNYLNQKLCFLLLLSFDKLFWKRNKTKDIHPDRQSIIIIRIFGKILSCQNISERFFFFWFRKTEK